MKRLISQLESAWRYVRGQTPAGRNFTILEDDMLLVSYPKSGNTWARFLIGNLISPQKEVNFANINAVVPDPQASTDKFLLSVSRPRVLKSHWPFDPRYKRVIYLVRDPRDVVLSQYHFQLKRGVLNEGYSIEQFVAKFLRGEVSVYGSWRENVASWIAAREGDPDFLLVRYEDLLANTAAELARIATFIGCHTSTELLHRAIDRSSAENMRASEKQHGHLWSTTKDTRRDLQFVRTATAGDWRNSLPQASREAIESHWAEIMQKLGYGTHPQTLHASSARA